MPTEFIHRLLLVVPAARCAALNNWIQNQIDLSGGDWLVPNLSTTGNAPATHAWCNAALTEQQSKKFLTRLTVMSGIEAPADWDTYTRKQKRNWLLSQRTAIKVAIGVWIVPMHNDEDPDDPSKKTPWDNPQEALDAMGLQIINS